MPHLKVRPADLRVADLRVCVRDIKRLTRRSTDADSCSNVASAAAGNAYITKSHPFGWSAWRAIALSRRLMRLRVTALPTRFGIAKPYRGSEQRSPESTAVMARIASRARLPSLSAFWNSLRRRIRRCFWSPICVHIRLPLKRLGLGETVQLNGEALTTLSASARQNCTPTSGGHSRSESVNAGTAAFFGLVRSLRHGVSCVVVANNHCILRPRNRKSMAMQNRFLATANYRSLSKSAPSRTNRKRSEASLRTAISSAGSSTSSAPKLSFICSAVSAPEIETVISGCESTHA